MAARVKVRHKESGDVLEVFSVDARECVASGDYAEVDGAAAPAPEPEKPAVESDEPADEKPKRGKR